MLDLTPLGAWNNPTKPDIIPFPDLCPALLGGKYPRLPVPRVPLRSSQAPLRGNLHLPDILREVLVAYLRIVNLSPEGPIKCQWSRGWPSPCFPPPAAIANLSGTWPAFICVPVLEYIER